MIVFICHMIHPFLLCYQLYVCRVFCSIHLSFQCLQGLQLSPLFSLNTDDLQKVLFCFVFFVGQYCQNFSKCINFFKLKNLLKKIRLHCFPILISIDLYSYVYYFLPSVGNEFIFFSFFQSLEGETQAPELKSIQFSHLGLPPHCTTPGSSKVFNEKIAHCRCVSQWPYS